MNMNRFKACSAAYGADRRRWPEAERSLHDRFAQTLDGAGILAAAERADRFLDAYELGALDPRLARRIAGLSKPRWRRLGATAIAFAASAALGFILGFTQVRSTNDNHDVAQLLLGPTSLQELGL